MGTIQYQLAPADLAQLKAILRQCPSFNTLTVEVRQAVLQSCSVDCFFDHSPGFYQLKVDFFVTVLCATLLKNDINDNPALVHFLEYVVYEEIPPTDFDFVVQIMKQLKQQQPSTIPNEIATRRNRLRDARQQAARMAQNQPQAQPISQIAKHDWVEFDLEKVISQFIATVKYAGIYQLTTSSDDRAILQEYIIERLMIELRRKTNRSCHHPYDLWLEELSSPKPPKTVIEYGFSEEANVVLEKLFKEDAKQDVVLVIWNTKIPEATLHSEINAFSARLAEIATPYFKKRCLLVIWANVGLDKMPFTHNALTVLPPLKYFDKDDLQVWLEARLTAVGLAPEIIQRYLNQISAQKGRLIPTYNTLQKIIRTINESSQGVTT